MFQLRFERHIERPIEDAFARAVDIDGYEDWRPRSRATLMKRTTAELEPTLDHILAAPKDSAPIEMIVRRPGENQREVIDAGELTTESGLVRDNWIQRVDENGEPHRAAQLTLMNSRVTGAERREAV